MIKGKYTVISEMKKGNIQYIIKDKYDILIGRFYVLDLNEKNSFALLRFKFYKKDDKVKDYIIDAVETILKYLFDNIKIDKVNIVIDEETDSSIFSLLGFNMEGFLFNSLIKNGIYLSEIVFGIDYETYKESFVRNNIVVKGDRISLKILTPKYSKDLLEYCVRNKEHLAPYEPTRESEYFTLEHQRKIIIEDYRSYLNGKSISFGIFKDEKLIGKIKISNIVLGSFRSGTIGYSMDKDNQGQGYMKEAVKLFINYAFDDLELNRIEASALVDNIKSQRVLSSAGFKKLGLNEKYLYINGKWRDHLTFYITNNKSY